MSLQHHRTGNEEYANGTADRTDATGPVGGFKEVKGDIEDLANLVDPYGWHAMRDEAVGRVQEYLDEHRPNPNGEGYAFFRTLGAAVAAATYDGMKPETFHTAERATTGNVPEYAQEILEPAIKEAYEADTDDVEQYLASARSGTEDWEAISEKHRSMHRGRL